MDFKKWVKNIQTAGYNGAHTVHGLVIFRYSKIAFSADQLIIQKQKLDFFSISKPCRYQFEAAVLNQEWLLYCT